MERNPPVAYQTPVGWYDRLVVGFTNYHRWPLAKKWAVVALFLAFSQLSFNLCVLAFEDSQGILNVAGYLKFAWLWLLYVVISIPVCAFISGRGKWSEALSFIIILGYLAWVMGLLELIGGRSGPYAFFPICQAVAAVLIFGPLYGALGGIFIFLSMVILDTAHVQGWLPLAPLLTERTIDAWNVPGWYVPMDLVAAQLIFVVVGLGALIFSARDRAEAALEHTQNLIRRYLPPAVADQIIAGKEAEISTPQRRRVTILFSDIVGFTDMADRVEPEVMTQVIGDYMAAMSEIVDQHQGTVNEFIGDGLMALFGAPTELDPEDQAKQAVLSAQAMMAKLPELNQQWRKLGLGQELQIRIGINTGMSSVGSYGSEGRMTYTAIGLQTNIAGRIQSKCEPGSILMSDATYQLIDDVIDCVPKGEIECKGVHYPVKVYAPS